MAMPKRVVTERDRPVGTPQPIKKKSWKSPRGAWIRKLEIIGDIVQIDTSRFWEALRKD